MTEISVDNNEMNLTSVAEVTENVSTEDNRRQNGAAPMVEVVGMTKGTRQEFLEGQSVVVNLSDRTLDEAEMSF